MTLSIIFKPENSVPICFKKCFLHNALMSCKKCFLHDAFMGLKKCFLHDAFMGFKKWFLHDAFMGFKKWFLHISAPVCLSAVVVAEVTQASLGVGYEIGRAVAMNKRILCLFRPSPDKRKNLFCHFIKGDYKS